MYKSRVTPIPQPLEKNFISYFIRNLMICKFGTFFARRLLQHFSSRSSSKDESCSVAGYLHQDLCRVSKGKDKRKEEGKGKCSRERQIRTCLVHLLSFIKDKARGRTTFLSGELMFE